MSTGDNTYYRGYTALRERYNYASVFEGALDELSHKVDFSWVKSCVAIGVGFGANELVFARRFLPNLQRFVGVEQDRASIKAFVANVQAWFICFTIYSYITIKNL